MLCSEQASCQVEALKQSRSGTCHATIWVALLLSDWVRGGFRQVCWLQILGLDVQPAWHVNAVYLAIEAKVETI